MNNVIKLIQSRRSIGKLNAPFPNNQEIEVILKTALTAPDHKKLFPYKIAILTNSALDRFGNALLNAGKEKAQLENKVLDENAIKKLLNMPKRAPMIIMVATDFKQHHKVPEFEQLLSVGAMVQNILLSIQSLGYKSIWRSGELTNEQSIKDFFEISENNVICGFIYVGSSDIEIPDREDFNLDDIVQFMD